MKTTAKISSALTKKPGKIVINPSEPPIRDTNESAISGIATSTNPPRMTPFRLYRPVTTAPPSRAKERLSGNALGETPLISITSKPPDNPATPELIAKAVTFNRPTLIPDNSAAIENKGAKFASAGLVPLGYSPTSRIGYNGYWVSQLNAKGEGKPYGGKLVIYSTDSGAGLVEVSTFVRPTMPKNGIPTNS